MSTSVATQLPTDPAQILRGQLQKMTPEFASALPSNIRPERFQRVIMTIVQQQPDLLDADRRSLLAACTKCAADGLIPDGREAALVIFNQKVKREGREVWIKTVQYLPMLTGILKRARNSGEIAGIIVNVVHEADEFIQRPDDFDKPLEHRPPKLGKPRGKPIGAYALAKLKDGTIMHEVMDISQIETVRAVSRTATSGPWVAFWDQMARKTVFRRLAKYLPMSAEDDVLLRRDDEAGAPTEQPVTIDGNIAATELADPELPAEPLDAFEQATRGGIIEQTAEDPEPQQEDATEQKPAAIRKREAPEVEAVSAFMATNPTADSFISRLPKMKEAEFRNLDADAVYRAWLKGLDEADYKRVQGAIADRLAARMGAG